MIADSKHYSLIRDGRKVILTQNTMRGFRVTAKTLTFAVGLLLIPSLLPTTLSGDTGRAWAACSPFDTGTAGNDVILCDAVNDPAGANVNGQGGDDTITLNGSAIAGSINGGNRVDVINLINGSVGTDVNWGAGDESGVLDLTNVTVGRHLIFGDGTDVFTLSGGTVEPVCQTRPTPAFGCATQSC